MCRLGDFRHQPLLCIIPPHMLKVLAMRGDEATAKMAKSMLSGDMKVREERSDHARSGRMVPAETPMAGFMTAALASSPVTRSLNRKIYDGQKKATLPGKLVRKEGDDPTGDAAVDAAYDGAGTVYDFYFDEFERDSIDGEGMDMVATVHHRRKHNNAYWSNAKNQMIYGDGDSIVFDNLTELSVVAHEMTHGIVQHSGGLDYEGQSGALNESFADCLAAAVVQKHKGQTAAEADWLIGAEALGPDINGVALRSLKEPGLAYSDAVLGKDPQPFHMDHYVNTTDDFGGVHINSGIPNHAFYLYCQYMTGNAWETPAHVWYDAMQRLNNPLATFQDWANQTMESAARLHSLGSREMVLLRRSWKLVGIDV